MRTEVTRVRKRGPREHEESSPSIRPNRCGRLMLSTNMMSGDVMSPSQGTWASEKCHALIQIVSIAWPPHLWLLANMSAMKQFPSPSLRAAKWRWWMWNYCASACIYISSNKWPIKTKSNCHPILFYLSIFPFVDLAVCTSFSHLVQDSLRDLLLQQTKQAPKRPDTWRQ